MIILQGDGWVVRDLHGVLGVGVYSSDDGGSHLLAVRTCADQAHAGNELALTAVLMCENDVVLQRYMKVRA